MSSTSNSAEEPADVPGTWRHNHLENRPKQDEVDLKVLVVANSRLVRVGSMWRRLDQVCLVFGEEGEGWSVGTAIHHSYRMNIKFPISRLYLQVELAVTLRDRSRDDEYSDHAATLGTPGCENTLDSHSCTKDRRAFGALRTTCLKGHYADQYRLLSERGMVNLTRFQ